MDIACQGKVVDNRLYDGNNQTLLSTAICGRTQQLIIVTRNLKILMIFEIRKA